MRGSCFSASSLWRSGAQTQSLQRGVAELQRLFHEPFEGGRISSLGELVNVCESRREALRDVFKVSRTDVLHAVRDLPERIVKCLPDAARRASLVGILPPLPFESEDEAVTFFVDVWLERLLPVRLCDTISLLDVHRAVLGFRRFVDGVAFDQRRWGCRPLTHQWAPATMEEEMAYIPILHWLQDHPASQHRVLEVGCGCGHVTDLLLKGGAKDLLAVDYDSEALETTEEVVKWHWRLQRSTSVGRRVEVLQTPLLPMCGVGHQRPKGRDGMAPNAKLSSSVFQQSADRRRAMGRQHRNGAGLQESLHADESHLDLLPFRTLCFHTPPVNLRFDLAAPGPSSRPYAAYQSYDAWVEVARRVRESAVLSTEFDATVIVAVPSFLVVPADVRDVGESASEFWSRCLTADGSAAASGGHAFELARASRHSLTRRVANDNTFENFPGARAVLKSVVSAGDRQRLADELRMWQSRCASMDFLVFQRSPLRSAVKPKGHASAAVPSSESWFDTVEYTNYLPKKGPPNPFHWTERIPSYHHLDETLPSVISPSISDQGTKIPSDIDRSRLLSQRTDPTSAIASLSPRAQSLSDSASVRFASIFSADVKNQRRSKMRKLAFASKEKQEWYLDEKLVKSEAARVSVMNEVIKKFDIPIPD